MKEGLRGREGHGGAKGEGGGREWKLVISISLKINSISFRIEQV